MAYNRHFFNLCGICGGAGHKDRQCPLYRLNEQQEVHSTKQARPAASPKKLEAPAR